MAFTTSVLLAAEQLMVRPRFRTRSRMHAPTDEEIGEQCKHLLATRLAMALGKCRETRVRGEAVALLMR